MFKHSDVRTFEPSRTFGRSNVRTFKRSNVRTFECSNVWTFERFNVRTFENACLGIYIRNLGMLLFRNVYEAISKSPPGRQAPRIWWKFFRELRFVMNLRFFGRTDLRISLSRAKFDVEADFDVRSAVAPPKPGQIGKKRNFRSKIFAQKIFVASKNETSGIVWNAFWQSFAPIRAKFET